MKEVKAWEAFDRTQIEQIIQGNIRSVDEKMGQMLDLFITSGYYLRRQYAEQQYKEAGYDRFDDYVKDVYGKSRAWATRMMQINEQYSIGGNDPRLDPQYRGYGISQLQEMLYLSGEQREQVTPDMTVREIRALRETEPAKEDDIPGQMEVEDYPEMMPGESTSEAGDLADKKPTLRKPDTIEKDILSSLSVNLIKAMRDWFLQDYHGRVLDVVNGEKALKSKFDGKSRTWSFHHDGILCHANLFDDYVQIWAGADCIGNFEWFYLSAAIQSMWNVVALEHAQNGFATSQKRSDFPCDGCAYDANSVCNYPGTPDNYCVLGDKREEVAETSAQPKEGLIAVCSSERPEEVIDAEYADVIPKVTPQSILEEAKRNLDMYIEYEAPAEMLEKQKIIVVALAGMVCDLEEAEEAEEAEEPNQPELPKFKNNDQRKAWLEDYKAWGMWYRDDRIDVNYYKYDFPDGSRLIAAEYPGRENPYIVRERDEVFYHLLDKRKKPICSDKYCHAPISMTYLVELLKEVQR